MFRKPKTECFDMACYNDFTVKMYKILKGRRVSIKVCDEHIERQKDYGWEINETNK